MKSLLTGFKESNCKTPYPSAAPMILKNREWPMDIPTKNIFPFGLKTIFMNLDIELTLFQTRALVILPPIKTFKQTLIPRK